MSSQNIEDLTRRARRLQELIWGCAISQAIHVAVELRIPQLLEDGEPKNSDEIAQLTSCDSWTLEAVLRALAAFEILHLDAQGRFSLAEMGRLLLEHSPASFPGEAGVFFETIWRPLGALEHAVKTGENAFEHIFGEPFYEYLTRNDEVGSFFNRTMVRNSRVKYKGLSSVYNFSEITKIVDVGGGEGGLILQLLKEQPHLRAVLFDLPTVVANARVRIAGAKLLDRCQIVAGSFFDSVPAGGDIYILGSVINNWNDEKARQILANCRSATGDRVRVLIIENLFPLDRPAPLWAALVGLGVLAQRGGQSRTEFQMRRLLESAQFRLSEIRPFRPESSVVIEAEPC
jgi:hypothetical protein